MLSYQWFCSYVELNVAFRKRHVEVSVVILSNLMEDCEPSLV